MNAPMQRHALVCILIVVNAACFAQENKQPVSAGAGAPADPVLERIQREIVGSWIVEISGVNRPLTFTVRGAEAGADGVFNLDATFGFTDGGNSAVKAKVRLVSDVYKLEFVNTNGTVYAAEGSANGTLAGSNTPTSGSPRPLRLVRTSDDELKQRVASLADARAALTVKPGPDVPESCARFFGGWVGRSRIDVGLSRLWVLGIKADCMAQVSYRAPSPTSDVPYGDVFTAQIAQGTLSLPCGNSGTCVFEVHGVEVWGSYTNPSGGSNSSVFQRIK
jgi:hypothetical protein